MPRAKLLFALAIVFVLGTFMPYLARTAEEKPFEIPALKVAYIDMGEIFQKTQAYKNAIDKMKKQTTELEEKFKSEYEDMKNLAEVLKGYPPESDDYKRTEAELGKKELDFKYRQAEARKDFEKRINDVQYKLYQQIERVARKFCGENGIGVLLRHNTSSPDGTKPEQVLRAINQSLVVADPRLNVTEQVLARLNTEPLEVLEEPAQGK